MLMKGASNSATRKLSTRRKRDVSNGCPHGHAYPDAGHYCCTSIILTKLLEKIQEPAAVPYAAGAIAAAYQRKWQRHLDKSEYVSVLA